MWQCKWCHLVAKFTTNASSAIWWPNLQPKQVTPSGGQIQPMHVASSGGQVYIQCKWRYLVLTKKKIKKIGWETYGPNTPGLMCLWQCFAMSFGSQPLHHNSIRTWIKAKVVHPGHWPEARTFCPSASNPLPPFLFLSRLTLWGCTIALHLQYNAKQTFSHFDFQLRNTPQKNWPNLDRSTSLLCFEL